MAAYIVFETGHTFGPSVLYPVYRLVVVAKRYFTNLPSIIVNYARQITFDTNSL